MRLASPAVLLLCGGLWLMAAAPPLAPAADPAPSASYQDAVEFLRQHTRVIELVDGQARVAVCPEYQGRVMTSTAAGPEGRSFGWVNRAFIGAGQKNRQFNNYGGEDRFWLGPEGGQFALWFAPGAEQKLANWFTPPALNEGAFQVESVTPQSVEMSRRMELVNASNTEFKLGVDRDIRMLDRGEFARIFGPDAAELLSAARLVGFESENAITNLGADWSKERGLVSIWILGMFAPGPETYVIVPYRKGSEAELGPIVNTDYFGEIPPERLKVIPSAILFHGDGNYRSKIGTSQQRARPVAGSIDFRNRVLTLVHFSVPKDPTQHAYVNNSWDLPQQEPYQGDVFNSYNDGPPEPGTKSLGGFYELETLSPAAELKHGASLRHSHQTFHVQGDLPTLNRISRAALGVDLEDVRRAMQP